MVQSLGGQKYRAKQIFGWLYKGVTSFEEMTNVSQDFIKKLEMVSFISYPIIENKLVSKIDKTTKYLFKLSDGNFIESVIMYYKHGISICISSQVGCRMGCKFCASTIGGLVRSLTAGEIIDQVIFAMKDLDVRVSNIVIMGIGEPLDNYDNVIKFLRNINDENGINIGFRHISLSTCGLVDGIKKLAMENIPLTLSISLHAPNDEIRNRIMPVSSAYSMEKLLFACRDYVKLTGRRITFEYTMIDGVNDLKSCAIELSKNLSNLQCHINLIPVNSISERSFVKSSERSIVEFKNILERKGFTVTVRRELGSDIMASCGQLRQNRDNTI